MNVPVDYIHANEIAQGKASKYKMVYLPYPLMVSEPTARGLVEYVRGGGTLVAEARAAWNNERGLATEIIPGSGLHEVCSCRETSVQQTPGGKHEFVLAEQGFAGLAGGTTLRGVGYEETLEPLSDRAQVVARFAYGGAAMIASTFGKGKMLTIGSFVSAGYELDRNETVGRFFRGLLDWSGIKPPVTVSGAEEIEVRLLEKGDETVLVVFNHGQNVATPAISLREGFETVVELGGTARAPSRSLKPEMQPGTVRVFLVR